MNERDNQIKENVILQAVVGSTVYGLNTGSEDRDELGVTVEPLAFTAGLSNFEQLIYRSAVERTGDHNARSEKGDLDLTLYSLRKYVKLALKGNPTIIGLLFHPNPMVNTATGKKLRSLVPDIISKRAGRAFLGYMEAQRQRMAGERGGKHGVRHLVDGCPYDTKYAMHMLRLGFEGYQLMTSGYIQLPLPSWQRELLLGVRRGQMSEADLYTVARHVEAKLKEAINTTRLPDNPNTEKVEAWVIQTYRTRWLLENFK